MERAEKRLKPTRGKPRGRRTAPRTAWMPGPDSSGRIYHERRPAARVRRGGESLRKSVTSPPPPPTALRPPRTSGSLFPASCSLPSNLSNQGGSYA